jgi:hypothetical protein
VRPGWWVRSGQRLPRGLNGPPAYASSEQGVVLVPGSGVAHRACHEASPPCPPVSKTEEQCAEAVSAAAFARLWLVPLTDHLHGDERSTCLGVVRGARRSIGPVPPATTVCSPNVPEASDAGTSGVMGTMWVRGVVV